MNFIKNFIGFFSKYAHPHERKVDKFFNSVNSNSNNIFVKKRLEELMQQNLAVLTIWMEKKYKGYRFLKKRVRKLLYRNLQEIEMEFLKFEKSGFDLISVDGFDLHPENMEKLKYLARIMSFLRPGGNYKYINSTGFFRLLVNLSESKMVGDCNQIVTFYIYLYSLRYPISDLEIKLLPEHVCLLFKGIDVEATSGTFENYVNYTHILPVTEIVSTNLLDITDQTEKVDAIDPRILIKSALLAEKISSLQEVVRSNLSAAYHNLALSCMKNSDFDSAIYFAEKKADRELLATVYNNAAIYFMNVKNFEKALFMSQKSGDRDLENQIIYNQGVYYYNAKNFERALTLFQKINDQKMIRECYKGQFNEIQKTLKDRVDSSYVKSHRGKYQKLLELARKIEDPELVSKLQQILTV